MIKNWLFHVVSVGLCSLCLRGSPTRLGLCKVLQSSMHFHALQSWSHGSEVFVKIS